MKGDTFMEQRHLLISNEFKHLLKIVNIWNDKFPGSPIPEWITKRCDTLSLQAKRIRSEK